MVASDHIRRDSLSQFGVAIDSVLERRERFANRYDYDFGRDRIFPELVDALLEAVPEGSHIVEVGAATGLLTESLLTRAGHITAMEPSEGMLQRLLAKEAADSPYLRILKGLAEDLAHNELFEVAVVTFTPRRGVGLLRLLQELAVHVTDRVLMLLDDDPSMDWAYLARAAAAQGFDIDLRFVVEHAAPFERGRRAVLLSARPGDWVPLGVEPSAWGSSARTVVIPCPAPRGAATDVVRGFLASGERALLVHTEACAVDKLYGALRTAVHRLAKDDVTLRRTGEEIGLVRLPKPS